MQSDAWPVLSEGMNESDLDKELGMLVRRAVNSGMEPIVVLGFLTQNAIEVAMHGMARAEAMDQEGMKKAIREAFKAGSPPKLKGD